MEKEMAQAMINAIVGSGQNVREERRNRYDWVCNTIRNYEVGTQKLFGVTIEELKTEREQLKRDFGF